MEKITRKKLKSQKVSSNELLKYTGVLSEKTADRMLQIINKSKTASPVPKL